MLDSPDRENEGDLIIAARHFTPPKAAFMVRHTSGVICVPLAPALADRLELPQMIDMDSNRDPNRTAYTVSVDAVDSTITTGISAYDRSFTCQLLADDKAQPHSFRRPGHIFPLRAREGGVRSRGGHTEAAIDFCRLADVGEAAVICELVEDGQEDSSGQAERYEAGMMRRDACLRFARRWNLKICTIDALANWLRQRNANAN